MMISSYLLHTGYCENTKDALRFYGDARTLNNKVCSHGLVALSNSPFSLQKPRTYGPNIAFLYFSCLFNIDI